MTTKKLLGKIYQQHVIDTPGILRLAKDASGRNRSVVSQAEFKKRLDPEGVHVLACQMIHNDCELRTEWLCKFKGREEPVSIWLDVSFERFNEYVQVVVAER